MKLGFGQNVSNSAIQAAAFKVVGLIDDCLVFCEEKWFFLEPRCS